MAGIGFAILSAVMILLIYNIIIKKSFNRKLKVRYFIFLAAWLSYVLAIQSTGILTDFSLPPRFPLLVIIPAFVLVFVVTANSGFKALYGQVSRQSVVLLQSFRIMVEILIYIAALEAVIPLRATFEGLNYDILVGITALPVAWLVAKGKINSRGLLTWNVASLMILSLTGYAFISSFYSEVHFPDNGLSFVRFPYMLLPSLLLPIAVFLHVFSIKQIRTNKESK